MLVNTLRMFLCIVIGFGLVVLTDGFSGFSMGSGEVFISLLSGISNAIFVVSWLFAVKRGAYMLVDVFLTLGLILPITLCAVFFNERLEWNHFVGFAILVVAVAVMCSYNNTVKNKLNLKSLLLLILCGLSQGGASFAQKWFVRTASGASVSAFNFYTYVFASVTLIVCYFLFAGKLEPKRIVGTVKPIWYFVVIMAVMLFLHSYLMTLAASKLNAVLIYPLSTGLALAISAAMSRIAFKEKLTVRCIVGIVLSFISLLIINLL